MENFKTVGDTKTSELLAKHIEQLGEESFVRTDGILGSTANDRLITAFYPFHWELSVRLAANKQVALSGPPLFNSAP